MADAIYGPGTGTADYPAYRFHKTEEMRLVQTKEADEALGDGWRDHPYTDEEKAAPPVALHGFQELGPSETPKVRR